MNAVADKLREARGYILRGWAKDILYSKDGCVCVIGALMEATGRGPAAIELGEEKLAPALVKGVKAVDPSFFGFAMDLPDWNDAPERTQAEVIAAFDKAIELAEAVQ